jgi:hypothetical protein
MSDLKHKSAAELRNLVQWCTQKRASQKSEWEAKEAEVKRLMDEAAELRRLYHNIGQKEAWARVWLARKDTHPVPETGARNE